MKGEARCYIRAKYSPMSKCSCTQLHKLDKGKGVGANNLQLVEL